MIVAIVVDIIVTYICIFIYIYIYTVMHYTKLHVFVFVNKTFIFFNTFGWVAVMGFV